MINIIAQIATGILLLGFVMSFIRLLNGPSLPDRIVALDLIASISMGMVIVFIFISGKTVYLDIVLIIALIVFLGTITVAKYLKKEKV